MYIKPMTFQEYLVAAEYLDLLEILSNLKPGEKLDTVIQIKLEQLLREYFVLGGMPEVIKNYLEYKDIQQCNIIQLSLLNTFRNDFGKYASRLRHKYLQKIFEKSPQMIGQHFKFSKVDPHMQSRDLRKAMEALKDAGLIHDILNTKANGLPLNSSISEKKFKILFLDIGLVKASSKLDANTMLNEALLLLNQGQLAEQFVGQELLSHSSPYDNQELYYWEREKKTSQAELDYITSINDQILAIEVKSGKIGRLKSLQVFLQNCPAKTVGIRISLHPLGIDKNILSIPLYMIHEMKRLVV